MISFNETYFTIYDSSPEHPELRSNCTGHTWMILHFKKYVLLHKHKDSDNYHFHHAYNTLEDAVAEIYSHDMFQLNGRQPVPRFGKHS